MSTYSLPAAAAPAAQTMEAFFTRQRANEGVQLPLALPDGTLTEHWLRIRGIDSDSFKQAEAEAKRQIVEHFTEIHKEPAKVAALMNDSKRDTIGALIISWSFAEPCTPEAVKKFLTEAPQIAEQIDALATKRRLFFKQGSPTSTPSPAPSSS